MRDSNRIHVLLSAFERLWNKFPDMRLFQLINLIWDNTTEGNRDPFFIEDDKWLAAIEKTIEKYS